jgi:2-phospho-L-lactate guanylyltransferase
VTCWAIIPVKAPAEAKMRLAGVLDPEQRGALVRAMLEHVTEAAASASAIDRTCLIGPSRHGLRGDLPLLDDPGGGLNAALQSALGEATRAGASRVVFVAADLSRLVAHDLQLLALAPAGQIAIAPDRHGTGTNALSLPVPQASGFQFAFGPDSFARHRAEAERLGLQVEVIHSPGLARDIDEPGDLPDAVELTGGRIQAGP